MLPSALSRTACKRAAGRKKRRRCSSWTREKGDMVVEQGLQVERFTIVLCGVPHMLADRFRAGDPYPEALPLRQRKPGGLHRVLFLLRTFALLVCCGRRRECRIAGKKVARPETELYQHSQRKTGAFSLVSPEQRRRPLATRTRHQRLSLRHPSYSPRSGRGANHDPILCRITRGQQLVEQL